MRPALAQFGGLVFPPAAWAANTQLGQILPHADCAAGIMSAAIVSFGAALLAMTGTLMSYRAHAASVSRRMLFLSRLSLMMGAAFVFALLLQGAATLLLDACAR
jgi:hypothetical protein